MSVQRLISAFVPVVLCMSLLGYVGGAEASFDKHGDHADRFHRVTLHESRDESRDESREDHEHELSRHHNHNDHHNNSHHRRRDNTPPDITINSGPVNPTSDTSAVFEFPYFYRRNIIVYKFNSFVI